jgi:hypothetical protein
VTWWTWSNTLAGRRLINVSGEVVSVNPGNGTVRVRRHDSGRGVVTLDHLKLTKMQDDPDQTEDATALTRFEPSSKARVRGGMAPVSDGGWVRYSEAADTIDRLTRELAEQAAEQARLRGAMAADDARLRAAEALVWPDGLTFGSDAPDHLAEAVLAAQAERDTLRRALAGLTRFCAKATRYVGHGVDLIEHANGPYVMFSDIESVLRSPEPREPEAARTESPVDRVHVGSRPPQMTVCWCGDFHMLKDDQPAAPEPKEPQP